MHDDRYTRSKTTAALYLGLSAAVLVFLASAFLPGAPLGTISGGSANLGAQFRPRTLLLLISFVALAAAGIRHLQRGKHDLVINADGIRDGVVSTSPIPWTNIWDIDLVRNGDDLYQIRLTLTDGSPREVDLWGIAVPTHAVFGVINDHWKRNTSA